MPLFHVFDMVDNRRTGVPMAGVQVRAKFDDTGTIAPIYADQSGTAFNPPNYCVTDADGMYSFYIDSGEYTLEFLVGDVILKTIADFRPAGVGPSGPANSTYNTTAEIENADVSNVSAILAEVGKAGTFTTRDYVDFIAQVAADSGKVNYIRSVYDPTKVWVRTSILSDAASQTGASSGLTVDAELAAKATLTGVARTATNLGTFSGSTIPDNQAIKGAIQALETAVENTTGNAATKVNATAVGVAATDSNMGTTPGSILSDNGTAKQWFQESEAAIEARVPASDLAADTGAEMVGFKRPGLGVSGALRNAAEKAKDVFDIRDYDDIDLTGANDNAATLQAAFDQAVADQQALNFPGGQILVGSSIQVPNGLSVLGTSRTAKGPTATRLIFDDAAQLIHGDGTGDYEEGFLFRDIVVGNIQPTVPGSGSWTATDAVPIFVMNGAAQLDLQNVLFYGATRGVHMAGGGSIGRLNMENCGGQIFKYLVDIDLCADVPIFHNCRVWPFWSDTKPVNNFSCAEADAFILKRADTPIFSNPTTIAVRSGFRFANNVYGKTTRALISNPGFDYATTNIWFDSTCDGAYVWVSNLSAQANNSTGVLANVDGVTPRRNIRMDGVNCSLGVSGCDLGGASGSAVEVKGTSNEATFDGFVYVHSYGEGGGAEPCFLADATSRVFLPDRIRTDAPGAGALAGGAGRVDGAWLAYIPSVEPQGGALTAVNVVDAKFIRRGTRVSARVTLTFTNVGSATGYIRISAPTAVDNTFTAPAVNISTSQPLIAVSILGSPGYIQLQKAGGGNLAVTGETITVSFEYEAANG